MIANIISFIVLLLFFWGRSLRFTNLNLHIGLMLFCLVADFGLVLALVMMKSALSQVEWSMHWTLQIHIPVAVTTVALYIPTAWSGYQLWRGKESYRPRLRELDKFLVIFRVLTLVTSVMVYWLRVK